MQHDMMRHPAPPPAADNVGDVLASIRQLIAQDGAGCRFPDQALNAVPASNVRVELMPAAMPRILTALDPLHCEPSAEAMHSSMATRQPRRTHLLGACSCR